MTTNAQKTLLALAAGAMFGTLGGAGMAAAASNIIYQDNFTGSSTTPLNGAAPTVDNGASATWTADNSGSSAGYIGFADSGYTSEGVGSGGGAAYLKFTPVSGNIYTLSAGLNAITGANPGTGNDWLSSGFLKTPNTVGRFDAPTSEGAYAWALLRTVANTPVAGQNDGTLFTGPGVDTYGQNFNNAVAGVNTLSTVLNTGGSTWTWQLFLNGAAVSPIEAFPTNPTITAVGIGNDGSVLNGQFSNFELSSSPVPEPATRCLFALGGLGLLLAIRKRKLAGVTAGRNSHILPWQIVPWQGVVNRLNDYQRLWDVR